MAEVLRGLAATRKQLPSKLLYDTEGLRLFEDIRRQPEYELARTEMAILERSGADIGKAIGAYARIVEFGNDASRTVSLLRSLQEPEGYVQISPSPVAADAILQRVADEFPDLPRTVVTADLTQGFVLPAMPANACRTVLFIPGAAIGNLDKAAALRLLRHIRSILEQDGSALLGIDLCHDVAAIEAAHNDAAGATARFTLNLLARLNRELGADFDIARFAHSARYNVDASRIETYLVSTVDQSVRLAGSIHRFARDEHVLVEHSHQYSLAEMDALANRACMSIHNAWTDSQRRFALVNLGLTVWQPCR